MSEGAACAIVVRGERVEDFRKDAVNVKAIWIAADPGESFLHQGYDYTHVETTTRAAIRAYKEVDIINPREQINLM